jgi:hypothetical protein
VIDRERLRKRREDARGYIIIVVLVLVILGVGSYMYFFAPTERPIDPVTNCPTDGKPPTNIIVVLLDTTDRLSPVQNKEVMNALTKTLNAAPQYAEFQLFAVGPAGDSVLRPLATVCNPGSGEGQSSWYSNPNQMKRRWQQHFIDRLNLQFGNFLNAPSADTSPILESIQNVSASVFDAPAFDHTPKQLIIVSDMVQNTPSFSQYRQAERFDQFKQSSYYLTVRPHLDDVSVSILYLRRADVRRIQGRKHLEFWQAYFADAGGAMTGSESIEG